MFVILTLTARKGKDPGHESRTNAVTLGNRSPSGFFLFALRIVRTTGEEVDKVGDKSRQPVDKGHFPGMMWGLAEDKCQTEVKEQSGQNASGPENIGQRPVFRRAIHEETQDQISKVSG